MAKSPEGPKQRSQEAVRAAYSLIVEKGFEGLRTRDVAERVGINIATLHYYFPTKEDLIQGVVGHLMQELRTPRSVVDDYADGLERLRAEFTDIRARLKESPEQLVVLTELAVRSWRDPAIAKILSYLDKGWHDHIASILRSGIAQGLFRIDLDVESVANSMMSQLRGIGYQTVLEPRRLDALVEQIGLQIEAWVLLPAVRMASMQNTTTKNATRKRR